jgi:hypothetical protein
MHGRAPGPHPLAGRAVDPEELGLKLESAKAPLEVLVINRNVLTVAVHFAVLHPYIRTGLGEIETVEVHHLGPRRDKVFHKLLLRV